MTWGTRFSRCSKVGTVWLEDSRFDVIPHVNWDNLGENPVFQFPVVDRKHGFDPAEEIARHPIGAGKEYLWIVFWRAKDKNPAVFQEAINDASDTAIVGNAWKTRP